MEKMKNIIKWYPVIVILSITCTYCTKSDEYKKYMPDGEIIYPQKADSVKTFPGRNRIQLEWVIIDPKVTSCKIIYEQAGIQGSTTVPVHGSGYENDTIRVIIPDMEEANYRFKIVSYDDFGHTSIPVETEEQAYGEMYENSLLNRMLQSTSLDEDENLLQLEWYEAEATETGIKIDYTDVDGNNRTITVAASETSTTIPDFKITEPIYYSTMYRPVPSAIDIFYAKKTETQVEVITLPEKKGSWLFDDPADLTKATTGANLIAVGTGIASVGGPNASNRAVRIPLGSYFIADHGILPTAGMSGVSEYTFMFDIKLPNIGDGYRALFNTTKDNSDDADTYINNSGQIGLGSITGGYSNTALTANQWHRVVITVHLGSSGVNYYLNGDLILSSNTENSRFILDEIVLLFADCDGSDWELDVAEVAIWDIVLDAQQVKKLGRIK